MAFFDIRHAWLSFWAWIGFRAQARLAALEMEWKTRNALSPGTRVRVECCKGRACTVRGQVGTIVSYNADADDYKVQFGERTEYVTRTTIVVLST